jgi:hypothetical protein
MADERTRFLHTAIDLLVARRRWAAAEAMCRYALAQGVDTPPVRAAIATIGAAVGACERRGEGGTLLIREWGCGFWADVAHVLGQTLTAEVCGRRPVVHWGVQSMYSDGFGNAWERYFEPVGAANVDDVRAAESVYPTKWAWSDPFGIIENRWEGGGSRLASVEVFERREALVVSDFYTSMSSILPWVPAGHALEPLASQDAGERIGQANIAAFRWLVSKYVKVRAEHTERARAWFERHLAGAPTLGVHIRASDKGGEYPLLAQDNATYPAIIGDAVASEPRLRILLCTESEPVLREYRQRYGTRIVTTDVARTSTDVCTHFLGLPDRVRLGVEALTDCILLSMCDRFVGLGVSNLSLFAAYLKDWAPDTCTLLGVNIHAVTSGQAHAQPALDELRAEGVL